MAVMLINMLVAGHKKLESSTSKEQHLKAFSIARGSAMFVER